MFTHFVNKREAERLTGLSHETLKKYRLGGVLTEGVHWVKVNARVVRYNSGLLVDFFQNRHDPAAHQVAIQNYLASLPSNQTKARGRRAG